MTTFTYWPYDEVTLETNANDSRVIVTTPWLTASTDQAFFSAESLSHLSNKLTEKTLSHDDIALVSNFFRHFHHYPVAYILPMQKNVSDLDQHGLIDRTLLSHEQLESFLIATIGKDNVQLTLNDLSRREWDWDVEAALNFATVNNAIHPESIFSVARRYHIIETINSDKGAHYFRKLADLPPTQFRHAAAQVVRQNHYVTTQCHSALSPALAHAGRATPMLQAFIQAEKGHDKILGKALAHLDIKPEQVEVNNRTIALMAMLKFIAERNFLAFAMAVDAFERNNYDEVDPMAALLSEGGYQKSADFINLHMKINHEGNHDNIAQQFLQYMDLCPRDYALEALRLMEALSIIMCSVSKEHVDETTVIPSNQHFHRDDNAVLT